MASSHREHRQDNTVLSCLVVVHGDKSRLVHKCVHTSDKTKLFCLQYIENCLRLSQTQFTVFTPLTVLSCQCRRCELGTSDCHVFNSATVLALAECLLCHLQWRLLVLLSWPINSGLLAYCLNWIGNVLFRTSGTFLMSALISQTICQYLHDHLTFYSVQRFLLFSFLSLSFLFLMWIRLSK